MDSEIISALITSAAAIISAIIGNWVAIKIKDVELKTKEAKTGQFIDDDAERKSSCWLWSIVGAVISERKSSRWLWSIVGAVIGAGLVFGILSLTNGISIFSTPTPTVVANLSITPSPISTDTSVPEAQADTTDDAPTNTPKVEPINTSTSTPKPSKTPTTTATATRTPSPTYIPSTLDTTPSSTIAPPLIAKGNVTIQEFGTEHISLSDEDVVIGTADRFQDQLGEDRLPFTIFIVYGPLDTDISLWWGGWDIWGNASAEHIEKEMNKKIEEVRQNHPEDYKIRGYRVIKCYGQVANCEVVQTYP